MPRVMPMPPRVGMLARWVGEGCGVSRLAPVVLCLGMLLPWMARALEPTTVSVEGVVAITEESEGYLRERALRVALEEAVFEVARLFLSPDSVEFDEERVREALSPRAPSFVLTYRVEGTPRRRISRLDPSVQEYVLGLTATVDAAPVRGELRSLGLLRSAGDRPSVVVYVVAAPPIFSGAGSLLSAFERYVGERLRGEGFVVVEPSLRPGAESRSRSALDLARSVGADLGLDLVVSWTERRLSARVNGGIAEARGTARRARDGFEVASARFDAPAYHPDLDEAFVRAVEAVQVQLLENLIQQLGRNWGAMAQDDEPVTLQLSNVSSYVQIEAVQDRLKNVLGASEARLQGLGPYHAELLVEGPLSAGALQDRLAAVAFDGFRLEPVQVERDRVDLRVVPSEPEEGGP
jgi:hypothetical protein